MADAKHAEADGELEVIVGSMAELSGYGFQYLHIGELAKKIDDAESTLAALAGNQDVWQEVMSLEGRSLAPIMAARRSEQFIDLEVDTLANQLKLRGPDHLLRAETLVADLSWLYVPELLDNSSIVREKVVLLVDHLGAHQLGAPHEEQATSGWGRKALWLLRRAAKVAGGGLVVAANIVSPDVTGISKIASIAGGASTIVSAIPDSQEIADQLR